MNKKIDEGQIIVREKLSLPNFLLKNYEDIDIKTLIGFGLVFSTHCYEDGI